MTISLANLKNKASKKRKRKGRGNASGHGTYAGRGLKGQRSRTGGRKGLKQLGLKQTLRRIPKKKGFKSIHPAPSVVNLDMLNRHFSDGEMVNFKKLIGKGLVKYSPAGYKVLGQGKLTKKLTVRAEAFSKSAKAAILKAGGQAEALKTPKEE